MPTWIRSRRGDARARGADLRPVGLRNGLIGGRAALDEIYAAVETIAFRLW